MLNKSQKLALRVYCYEIFGESDPYKCLAIIGGIIGIWIVQYLLIAWLGTPARLSILGLAVVALLATGTNWKAILLCLLAYLMAVS